MTISQTPLPFSFFIIRFSLEEKKIIKIIIFFPAVQSYTISTHDHIIQELSENFEPQHFCYWAPNWKVVLSTQLINEVADSLLLLNEFTDEQT